LALQQQPQQHRGIQVHREYKEFRGMLATTAAMELLVAPELKEFKALQDILDILDTPVQLLPLQAPKASQEIPGPQDLQVSRDHSEPQGLRGLQDAQDLQVSWVPQDTLVLRDQLDAQDQRGLDQREPRGLPEPQGQLDLLDFHLL
jgi:hypothetical protein